MPLKNINIKDKKRLIKNQGCFHFILPQDGRKGIVFHNDLGIAFLDRDI